MALNIPGLIAMMGFYVAVLAIGIWASKKAKVKKTTGTFTEVALLGERSINLVVGIFTMTDWNQTDYGSPSPYERNEAHVILPLCLEYLSPSYVSILGIGAVTAAAMSSVDSFLLSSASMFTSNLYKNIIRKQASDKELQWVIRISIVITGVLGTSLTFIDNSIVLFWILSSDMAYCIILPQLICVLFCSISNTYGAVVGFIVSILLRLLSGEPLLGLPPVICYPGGEVINGVYIQPVPVRTMATLVAFFCILFFSYTIAFLFRREVLPTRWDIFGVTKVTVSTDNQNGVLTPLTNVAAGENLCDQTSIPPDVEAESDVRGQSKSRPNLK